MNKADLEERLKRAMRRVDAMTRGEREEMHRAQRESFVRGMWTPCEHGELDFESCALCRSDATNRRQHED